MARNDKKDHYLVGERIEKQETRLITEAQGRIRSQEQIRGGENPKDSSSRLAVVTEIISPYRIPVFNSIGERLGNRFKAFFMGVTTSCRLWEVPFSRMHFDYEVLTGWALFGKRREGFPHFWNPGITRALHRFRPSLIVLGGYHHFTSYAVGWYAKKSRTKLYLWCESNLNDHRSRSFLIEHIKKAFIRSCDGYVVPGRASLTYLKSYGVDQSAIILAPNAIDTELFSAYESADKEQIDRERALFKKEWSLPEFNLLFIGRLSPEKGFPVGLEVLARLQGAGIDVGLIVVGDGPCRQKYERLTLEKRLKNVVFLGFKQPYNLPYYYHQGDLLIMPSVSEPWGLVVNESMTCGIPVLCSPRVGAAPDLVIEDKTGYQCKHVSDYVVHIRELLSNPSKLSEMKNTCREIATNFSPQACADGFLSALRRVSVIEIHLNQ
jgi:glycosyltransferase involved in cell wall biosynthesis